MRLSIEWGTHVRLEGDDIDVVARAEVYPGSPPRPLGRDGGDPGDPPEVELISVVTEQGRDVLEVLSATDVVRLEDQAVDESSRHEVDRTEYEAEQRWEADHDR